MAKMADLEFKIHEITDRIRELRSILGITEEEMAQRLGSTVKDDRGY